MVEGMVKVQVLNRKRIERFDSTKYYRLYALEDV